MRFTSSSAIVLFAFSTLHIQAAPLDRRAKVRPPPANVPAAPAAPANAANVPAVPAAPANAANDAVCAKATTCDDCILLKFQGGKCGFTFGNPGECTPINPAVKLATTTAQCKSLGSSNAAAAASSDDSVRAKSADTIFKGISTHVFQGTPAKKTSGRHLASTWIKANGASGRIDDPNTFLSSFPFGQKKTKTVWNDQSSAKSGAKYTQDIVTRMCKDAIVASMKAAKSTTTPLTGTHSFTVASFPNGPSVCVTFSQASCYPAKLAPQNGAVGQECTGDTSVED